MDIKKEQIDKILKQKITSTELIHWGGMSYWSEIEAITLSFELRPDCLNWEKWKEIREYTNHDFVQEYGRRLELLYRALSSKQIIPVEVWGAYGGFSKLTNLVNGNQRCFKPVDCIDWAKHHTTKITFPQELEELVGHIDWKAKYIELHQTLGRSEEDKKLHGNESNSLYQMIRGLVKSVYGIDNSTEGCTGICKTIESDIQAKNEPLNLETITKILNKAFHKKTLRRKPKK